MSKIDKLDKWNGQQLAYIPLDQLVLWSENPRDPIDPDADNDAILDNALYGPRSAETWNLASFASSMGELYDFSELPTVVASDDDKFVVYDGNRRVATAMAKMRGLFDGQLSLPLFPEKFPCVICDKETELQFVWRKHGENGTWTAYDRDVFANRYMGKPKSVLVRIDELCGGITRNPVLNSQYARNEVLSDAHLAQMGLLPDVDDYGVSAETLRDIIDEISKAVSERRLGKRSKNRSNPIEVLDDDLVQRVRRESHASDSSGGAWKQGSFHLFAPDRDLPEEKETRDRKNRFTGQRAYCQKNSQFLEGRYRLSLATLTTCTVRLRSTGTIIQKGISIVLQGASLCSGLGLGF